MRNIILFTYLVCFLFNACIKDPPFSMTIYRIYNSTNHNVELKTFDAIIYNDTLLSNDSTYNFINNPIIFRFTGGRGGGMTPLFGSGLDSAYITFDDSLRITYKRLDSNPRNILHADVPGYTGYSGGETDDYAYEYNYYITEDDYNNAVKIEN